MLNLEEDCPACKGTRYRMKEDYFGSPRQVACEDCEGGKVPTAEGRVLLHFLRTHLKVNVFGKVN